MKHLPLHGGHIIEAGPISLMRAIYGPDDRYEYVLDYDKENVAKVIDEVFDTLSERESLVIKGFRAIAIRILRFGDIFRQNPIRGSTCIRVGRIKNHFRAGFVGSTGVHSSGIPYTTFVCHICLFQYLKCPSSKAEVHGCQALH